MFMCNMLSQMATQQGFAWGPSPDSEILNISMALHTLCIHIFSLWLQHLFFLLSRSFMETFLFSMPTLFYMNPRRHQDIKNSPWSAVSLWGLFISSTAALHENSSHLLYLLIPSYSAFSSSLATLESLFLLHRLVDGTQYVLPFSSEWGYWAENLDRTEVHYCLLFL